MTAKLATMISGILDDLNDAGFDVVSVGTRWRVTNPAGGEPAFIPRNIARGKDLSGIVADLTKIGFSTELAEQAREKRRQERLSADRKAAAKAMSVATAAAAEREATSNGHAAPVTLVPWTDPDLGPDVVPLPRTEIIDITPTFAEELLRANHFYETGVNHAGRCNRKFKPSLAQEYAAAMLRDEWVLTEQGIGQDIDGELTNGQHRLMAVILAGEVRPDIVVPMQFTYDLPREARDVVDSGRRRTLGDNLGMHGEHDVNVLASICRLVHLYDTVPFTARDWKQGTLSTKQAREMLELEPDLRELPSLAGMLNREAFVLSSAGGAAVHLFRRAWPREVVDEFVFALRNGAEQDTGRMLERDNPVAALRSNLANQRHRRMRRLPPDHLALLIKTFNLVIEGEKRVLLRWDPDHEVFPAVVQPLSTRRVTRASRPTG